MPALGGLCESCGLPMQWCFAKGFLYVRCEGCPDLLVEDLETSLDQKLRVARAREGRETDETDFPF